MLLIEDSTAASSFGVIGILISLLLLGLSVFLIVIQILNWIRIKKIIKNLRKLGRKLEVECE